MEPSSQFKACASDPQSPSRCLHTQKVMTMAISDRTGYESLGLYINPLIHLSIYWVINGYLDGIIHKP